MANNWNIPDWLERKVRERDIRCVYCNVLMKKGDSRNRATFEHIENNAKNIAESNIALCCSACNSSKGARKLVDWLKTPYCKRKNINEKTAAPIVKRFLKK